MSWRYEVETAVDAMIFNLTTDHTRLLIQIILILTVNEVDDWLPAREGKRGKQEREGVKAGRKRGK